MVIFLHCANGEFFQTFGSRLDTAHDVFQLSVFELIAVELDIQSFFPTQRKIELYVYVVPGREFLEGPESGCLEG